MTINDSKIEFIEDDRLTDLAGGLGKGAMFPNIGCRDLGLEVDRLPTSTKASISPLSTCNWSKFNDG